MGLREMRAVKGFLIRLVDQEMWEGRVKELTGELDALSPGLGEKMKQEATASLTPEQQKLSERLPAEPTPEEYKLQEEATELVNITPAKIAARIAKDDPAKASRARRIAQEISDAQERVNSISINRDVANYAYWTGRGELEQTADALKARELAYAAQRAFRDEADPTGAKDLYEKSFDLWAKALTMYPALGPDSTMGSEIMDVIEEYNAVLEQLDLSLADKDVSKRFALWSVVEANDQERKFSDALDIYHARNGSPPPKPVAAPQDREAAAAIDPADALIPPPPTAAP